MDVHIQGVLGKKDFHFESEASIQGMFRCCRISCTDPSDTKFDSLYPKTCWIYESEVNIVEMKWYRPVLKFLFLSEHITGPGVTIQSTIPLIRTRIQLMWLDRLMSKKAWLARLARQGWRWCRWMMHVMTSVVGFITIAYIIEIWLPHPQHCIAFVF